MATRNGGEGGLVGEVDAMLKGGDGGAGELHKITMKLLEVTAWLEKERGELTTPRWSAVEGERGGSPVEEEVEKADCGRASEYK
jgi:hypothetical protein